MARALVVAACVAFFLLLPAAARASGGDVSFDDRPFNLQVRTGFGSSVGSLGLVGEFDLDDRFNVGAGAGTNLLGLIVGAHARLRPVVFRTSSGRAAHAIVAEGAVSRSRYSGSLDGLMSSLCEGAWDDPKSQCYDPPIDPEWVWWGQLEVGWEFRHRNGMLVRATTGAAVMLAMPDWKCTLHGAPAPCGHSSPALSLPTLTLAMGYAF
jgi:hypothetical protein